MCLCRRLTTGGEVLCPSEGEFEVKGKTYSSWLGKTRLLIDESTYGRVYWDVCQPWRFTLLMAGAVGSGGVARLHPSFGIQLSRVGGCSRRLERSPAYCVGYIAANYALWRKLAACVGCGSTSWTCLCYACLWYKTLQFIDGIKRKFKRPTITICPAYWLKLQIYFDRQASDCERLFKSCRQWSS